MKYIYIILGLVIIISSSSCDNHFKKDVSGIESPNVQIQRYEMALFMSDLNQANIHQLQKKFPLFLGDVPLDSIQMNQLLNYVSDPYLQKLLLEADSVFPDMGKEEAQIDEAFKHVKYYFPAFEYPKVYTYISGTQDQPYFQDGIVVLALDRYLGFGHEYYNMARIPKYQQINMTSENLSRDVVFAIAQSYISAPMPDANLLQQMIYQGKLMYFVKSMIPDVPDHVLFGLTKNNLGWLVQKEKDLWRYYIENELLYKSDYLVQKKFISEAPFTADLGDDSSPKTGVWLGYQIVFSYMKNNPIELSKMIHEMNAQELLMKSKYKPQK